MGNLIRERLALIVLKISEAVPLYNAENMDVWIPIMTWQTNVSTERYIVGEIMNVSLPVKALLLLDVRIIGGENLEKLVKIVLKI